jgi:imidazolonepropionase
VLDAPSHVHLAYRPGVPLVTATWVAGRPFPSAF